MGGPEYESPEGGRPVEPCGAFFVGWFGDDRGGGGGGRGCVRGGVMVWV